MAAKAREQGSKPGSLLRELFRVTGFLLTAKASVVDNLRDVTDAIRRDSGKTHG